MLGVMSHITGFCRTGFIISQDKSANCNLPVVREKRREGKRGLAKDGWGKPVSDKMVGSVTE